MRIQLTPNDAAEMIVIGVRQKLGIDLPVKDVVFVEVYSDGSGEAPCSSLTRVDLNI